MNSTPLYSPPYPDRNASPPSELYLMNTGPGADPPALRRRPARVNALGADPGPRSTPERAAARSPRPGRRSPSSPATTRPPAPCNRRGAADACTAATPRGVDYASEPDRWSSSNRFSNLSASFLGGSEARSTPSAMNPAAGRRERRERTPRASRKGRTTDATRRSPPKGDRTGAGVGAQGVERLERPGVGELLLRLHLESSSDVA